ncbi:CarD family transcriptional regulator [Parablautia muri]|uniref:CarD family transcriptional regulator n=1 Tax=Parablautia muri TaxID=2320879 RepID=A0A9X5BF37_9FIRM|nr:CarD family transcriptional regulator [Parablautia muri]NBJ92600.1 CarD family transcriptional regulator [Parablautia muri]
MFQKGEYVIYSNNGICLIQDITTLNLSGVDKNREYYLLKPVFASTSTVYIPVDTAEASLRPAISKDEAHSLIKSIPDIPTIPLTDEKTLEKTYKEYMRSNNCKAWVQLIKTIYLRKENRILKGHKVTALDSRYFNLAETSLYGELSVALGKPRDEVKSYIASCIDESGD